MLRRARCRIRRQSPPSAPSGPAPRDVPRDREALQKRHDVVEDQADRGQHRERREEELGAEVPARDQQEVAETAVRPDELADDRPDRGQRDRDL